MRTQEQFIREIGETELINPDMEPVVGSSLLKSGDKYKVQILVTTYDMLGRSFRERKTITITETSRNKAELKRSEIHKRIDATLKERHKEFHDAVYDIVPKRHELLLTMDEWLEYHEGLNDWAVTTLANYKDKMKVIRTYFSDNEMFVEEVTTRDITLFSNWAIQYGRVKPKKNEDGTLKYGLSHATVKDLHGMLYAFFKYVIEVRPEIKIKVNPCMGSSIPKEPKKRVEVDMDNREYLVLQIEKDHEKWMDEEQYKSFRQWLVENVDKYKHFKKLIEILEVLIFTGMRREELAGLRWANVDLEKGMLYVVETRVRAGNKEYSVNGCKNEDSVRKYPLREDLIELFSRMKERQERLGIYNKRNYIFVWENDEDNHGIKAGTPYKVDYLTKLFKKAVSECPYVSSKLTLHKTRHSCCSILFRIGWSMAEVQEWLGHKDGSKITEEVYNHHRQVVKMENIDALANRLK